MISIIAAVAEDMGLGHNNGLLWNIPEDLKRFKSLTMGKTVIMGKRTWESLPKRPLTGRRNIVITDNPSECFDCSYTAYSIDDAIAKVDKSEEAFIIGGASVYRQFMPYADRLYITHIQAVAEADVYFPDIDSSIWKVFQKEEVIADSSDKVSYAYVVYERINPRK